MSARKMGNADSSAKSCLGSTLAAALMFTAAALGVIGNKAFAQSQKPAEEQRIVIEGVVRSSKGEAIEGALVFLLAKADSKRPEGKTDAAGKFLLVLGHAGQFAIGAEKAGMKPCVLEAMAIRAGDAIQLGFVLRSESELPVAGGPCVTVVSPAGSGAMEFADHPNFTIAGVTDWSNVGLHGSDTRVRTSEALTKETMALKASAAENSAAEGKVVSSLDHESANAHRVRGDAQERSGHSVEAAEEYEQAARIEPSEENYFAWGAELLLHRATQPAVEVFARGVGLHGNSSRMLAGLGAALYATGKYEEAAERLCEASDRKPEEEAPYLFLGEMEKAATDAFPCSEEKLARLARQEPQSARANYYYALVLAKNARKSGSSELWKQVEKLLNKAVGIDPKFGEAFVQLGVAQSARGHAAGALSSYQQAAGVSPELGEAHYRLSLAYKKIGENAKAREEMQVYERIEKSEAAAKEKERRELRQFLVILKDEKQSSSPN